MDAELKRVLEALDYTDWQSSGALAKHLDLHRVTAIASLMALMVGGEIERRTATTFAGRRIHVWRRITPDWAFGRPKAVEA